MAAARMACAAACGVVFGGVAYALWARAPRWAKLRRRHLAARRPPQATPGEGSGMAGDGNGGWADCAAARARHVLWPDTLRDEGAELLEEQLSRGSAFVGAHAHAALCNSHVVIVGLSSGVGGHAAHLLARGGVQQLRLVGASTVTRASLVVEAVAVHSDIGRPCGDVLRAHLLRTVPDCRVEIVHAEWADCLEGAQQVPAPAAARTPAGCEALSAAHSEASSALHGAAGRPQARLPATTPPVPAESKASDVLSPCADSGEAVSLVLDCLVRGEDKAGLLAACAARGIRVISVGSVQGRGDLTRWHVSPSLADAAVSDPTIHAARTLLAAAAQRGDVAAAAALAAAAAPQPASGSAGAPGLVLWSSEQLRPRSARAEARCPERGPVAAGVGQMAALCAIALLTGKPPAAQLPARPAKSLLRRLAARLAARERDVFGADPQEVGRTLPMDALELACVAGWGMRCALTAEPLDSRAGNLALTRRDGSRPPSIGNVLLLRADLASAHDAAERPAEGWLQTDRRRIERICAVLAHAEGADGASDGQNKAAHEQ